MRIAILRESDEKETRVPALPEAVARLVKLGATVCVESGLGTAVGVADEDYVAVGATVAPTADGALQGSGLVLRLRSPEAQAVERLGRGTIHVSLMDPFRAPALVRAFAAAGVSAISLEMIPRSSVAQKMDVLSSQASIAGYVAVLLAAARLPKVFPMMMTPAGTLQPTRVLVIGAGVAGLQAIATARRLGARVEAFDTRPAVAEQVQSLGARFVKVDLGDTGETRDGYARQLSEEQLALQRDAMARHCASADVVITTAQVFGSEAPRIVTDAMLAGMRPGSVVVDMAVETGGNVEGVVRGDETLLHGVHVLGWENLAGRAAVHASQMLGSNLASLVEHFWDEERGGFVVDPADELMRGCLVTHEGDVVHAAIREAMTQDGR